MLLNWNAGAQTFDHLDLGCGHLDQGLTMAAVITNTGDGSTPGQDSFQVQCSACGSLESFNTNVDAGDASSATYTDRDTQATAVRGIMTALGWTENANPTPDVTR